MDREQILEQLRSHGITSLEQLADRAVQEAQQGGGQARVNVVAGAFISILT